MLKPHTQVSQRDESDNSRPEVSIVVPFYNEQESVHELHRRLQEQLDRRGCSYELIFVDDGSTDLTYKRLMEVHDRDPVHVRIVRLRRNFGQTAGLMAGFDHAEGDVVITMDGDLQHDPSDLPGFFEMLDNGYDLVSGWRKCRVDNFVMRRIPSRIANWMMAKLTGIPLHDFGTTFKAYRREIIDDIALHGEMHRFVPALLSWQGVSIVEIPISNIPRASGASHYGIGRTFRVLFDLLTVKFLLSYVGRPLHIFGLVGGAMFCLGFMLAAALTILYYAGVLLIGEHLGNLILSMLMMTLGIQLVVVGLTLEVEVRIFHATTGRRIYAVRSVAESTGKSV